MTGELAAPVEAVVFDFGGVLTTPVRSTIEAWVAADGIDPDSLTRTLRTWLGRDAPHGTPIHLLETGEMGPDDFERAFAAELDTHDGSALPADGLLGRLFAELKPEEEMYALAADLRSLGVRVGLLSNSWGNIYPRARLEALFDPIVISHEVGLRKPDASIYRLLLELLGVDAAHTVFIDDAEPNVAGAQAAGLQSLLHTTVEETRTALAAVIPDLRAEMTAPPGSHR